MGGANISSLRLPKLEESRILAHTAEVLPNSCPSVDADQLRSTEAPGPAVETAVEIDKPTKTAKAARAKPKKQKVRVSRRHPRDSFAYVSPRPFSFFDWRWFDRRVLSRPFDRFNGGEPAAGLDRAQGGAAGAASDFSAQKDQRFCGYDTETTGLSFDPMKDRRHPVRDTLCLLRGILLRTLHKIWRWSRK
jgi:hypothetical protein